MSKVYMEIQKRGADVIRLQRYEMKGREFIDLRVYFFASSANPDQPTRKGVTLNMSDIPRLRAAIVAAEADAVAEGLIDQEAYASAGLPIPAALERAR